MSPSYISVFEIKLHEVYTTYHPPPHAPQAVCIPLASWAFINCLAGGGRQEIISLSPVIMRLRNKIKKIDLLIWGNYIGEKGDREGTGGEKGVSSCLLK